MDTERINTSILDNLNQHFSFQKEKQFLLFKKGEADIPLIEIMNDQARMTISLQGAHVLSWVPKGEEELIWLSEQAKFATGKSVRGGIPVCWPWFGAHENNASYPAHGFARIVLWQVTDTRALVTGETQITFRLDTTQIDPSKLTINGQLMWPKATVAEYCLIVGKTLNIRLTTFNSGDQSITLGQALHTYFRVDDVSHTTVSGLEGKDYLDKTDGFARKVQSGPIHINDEIDRVYLETADDVIINDKKRKIRIKKQGSHSTVVWNPWQKVADKMGDLGKEGYLKMLCVESANAAEDTVIITAGESVTLSVTYKVEH